MSLMDFKLTGAAADKYILVQPSMVQDPNTIPGDDDTSDFVGQRVHLAR